MRSEGPLVKDKGITIVILNDQGQVVASATDEWGATLTVVAREYRGKGLGGIILKVWYKWNPSFKSGGFTPQGERAALQVWEDRVREFIERGWYSALVKRGDITKEGVQKILAGLGGRKKPVPSEKPEGEKEKRGATLIYGDYPTFVVYNSKFLEKQSKKYIHGYGFFRDSEPVGTFLYTIDYDREHRKLVTAVALHMAREAGDRIYVGEGYGDTVELGDINSFWALEAAGAKVKKEGDYVYLTRAVPNFRYKIRIEKERRKAKDRYGEIESLLLEKAESKW